MESVDKEFFTRYNHARTMIRFLTPIDQIEKNANADRATICKKFKT